MPDIVPRVFAILSKVHFTDLIKGQQHFTVIQISGQDRAFRITVTLKNCVFLKTGRNHKVHIF